MLETRGFREQLSRKVVSLSNLLRGLSFLSLFFLNAYFYVSWLWLLYYFCSVVY